MEYFNVFKGYYKHMPIPLIIDRNEAVVRHYMTDHRLLSSNEYYIEEEIMTDHDLYLKYEDQCSISYNKYIIPHIDAQIIEYHKSFMDSEIYDIIQRMKKITVLSQSIKEVSEGEIESLIKAMKVLSRFASKPKIVRKLADEEVITESILYCPITEYLAVLRQFKDHREMRNRWEYLCDNVR